MTRSRVLISLFVVSIGTLNSSESSVNDLTEAIEARDTERALKLIPHVNINQLDAQKRTPLIKALFTDNSAVFDALLEDDRLDINMADDFGRTTLIYAVLSGEIPRLKQILKVPTLDVNQPEKEGNTALMRAVVMDDFEAVKQLVARTRVNHQNKEGMTALMLAVQRDNPEIIESLLWEGANPFMQNREGKNSFDLASDDARSEMDKTRESMRKIGRKRYKTRRKETRDRIRRIHKRPVLFKRGII